MEIKSKVEIYNNTMLVLNEDDPASNVKASIPFILPPFAVTTSGNGFISPHEEAHKEDPFKKMIQSAVEKNELVNALLALMDDPRVRGKIAA